MCATVSSTLQYVNEEERPLDACSSSHQPSDCCCLPLLCQIGEQRMWQRCKRAETGQNADCASPSSYVTDPTVQEDTPLRFSLPADAVNPPIHTSSVHVSSPKPISKLESNCTLDPLVFLHSDHTQATVNLSPGHMFDKDLELFVYYQGYPSAPQL
ncbi:hypothetical protein QQF64_018741 [Cirrhinus molitorella]|uniref:Uncharacterized protein n=1 Tax=Cirrhinus molitorella TaxID=172907 RepID=A0ABR3LF22_9TELE